MKEISIDEQKKILLEMLQYVDDVCRKNNLKYFLYAGTLLGAIRHKGFIPWDDDVDICMPMKDYKRLIKIMIEENKYYVHSPYDDKNYYYFFTKITDKRTVLIDDKFKKIENAGLFLDIFPIYNLPNSDIEINEFICKIKKLEKIYFRHYGLQNYYDDTNTFKKIIKSIIYFPELFFKSGIKANKYKILKLMEKYENQETKYIGSVVPPCSAKSVFRKEICESALNVEFEKHKFYAPIGYEEFLTNMYGDYMTPPPENERIMPHNCKIYWI